MGRKGTIRLPYGDTYAGWCQPQYTFLTLDPKVLDIVPHREMTLEPTLWSSTLQESKGSAQSPLWVCGMMYERNLQKL